MRKKEERVEFIKERLCGSSFRAKVNYKQRKEDLFVGFMNLEHWFDRMNRQEPLKLSEKCEVNC